MNYQEITCQATGKTLKADNIYKVRDGEDCIENIVVICKSCPYVNSKSSACKNCYGTIVQNSARQRNPQTRKMKMNYTNYRNTFEKIADEYIDFMDADMFMDNIDIIANLNNSNWNHGQKIGDRLRAYDHSCTSKTDCAKCKKRCHDKGELTACEKAQKYCESIGISISKATSNQIANLDLPNNCICQEQVAQVFYI